MRSIRFDRGRPPEVARATKPMPPRSQEPPLKRLLQGGVLFGLLLAFGYWLASITAFHQYQGIVVGDQATLTATDAGVVKDFFKGLHQPFRAGDALMKLDNAGLRVRLDGLEREIAALEFAAQANESEELQRLQGQLEVARAQSRATSDLLTRSQRLRAEGALTQASVDAREREAQAAEAALAVANTEYERALQMGSKGKRASEAALLGKRGEREELRQKLDALTVRAAGDGIVAHVVKWRGDSAQAGEPLLQVFYQGEFSVDVYIDPEDRQAIPVGTEVKIKSGGALKIPLSGRVVSISPVTHTLPATHREVIAQVEQFIVAKVAIDLREALEAGLSPGQLVKVQVPRW